MTISTNIKTLRIEARLSIDELAEITNIDKNRLIAIEKGKIAPTDEEIRILCKPLHIGYEDMIERDILSERNDAGKRMKRGRDRNTYNWYLGDRKKMFLFLAYWLGIILFFLAIAIIYRVATIDGIEVVNDAGEIIVQSISIWRVILYAYVITSVPAGIIIVIWFLIRVHYQFAWWHIFLYSVIIAIVGLTGLVFMLPSIGYAFYKSVIKKGRN